jgi:hypothetical protein
MVRLGVMLTPQDLAQLKLLIRSEFSEAFASETPKIIRDIVKQEIQQQTPVIVRNVLQEEAPRIVKSVLKEELSKELKPINKELRQLRKDVNVMMTSFDRDYTWLRLRMGRAEHELNLPSLPKPRTFTAS